MVFRGNPRKRRGNGGRNQQSRPNPRRTVYRGGYSTRPRGNQGIRRNSRGSLNNLGEGQRNLAQNPRAGGSNMNIEYLENVIDQGVERKNKIMDKVKFSLFFKLKPFNCPLEYIFLNGFYPPYVSYSY